jgi:1,4-dihydroxy-6-naphthoate synthase
VLGEAIQAGLDNPEEALAYAQGFGRGIDRETVARFVAMYVNERTIGYGEDGRRAIEELFRRAGSDVEATYV